ncbi:MAG: M28 family peptidase, partial [Candidatus Limnocylindrales bacterium]
MNLLRRWTGEPAYADPDAAMRGSAAAWRAQLDPARLRELVEALPAPRSRLHHPEAMAATDALLLTAWAAAGWTVERTEVHLENVRGVIDVEAARGTPKGNHTYARLDGANLVAGLPGEIEDAIVIVAHHDTVKDSVGADDNGAGVVALLELARLLAGRRFHRTVLLAAPDFEEIGLLGSPVLVAALQARRPVAAAIVFDPIGYMNRAPDTQVVPPRLDRIYPAQLERLAGRNRAGDTVISIYQARGTALARLWARCLAATIGRDRVLLIRDPVDIPLLGRLARRIPAARDFSRSDHVAFWRVGLPALHVTNTGNFRNPNYHR